MSPSPSIDPAVWEAFFSKNPDPCFVYRVGTPPAPRFTLIAVNPTWYEVTGLPKDLLGKSLEELMPPEMVSVIAGRLKRLVQERVNVSYEEELRFRNEMRYWRTTLAPIVLDDEVRYIVGFGHDLTDMRNNAALERRLQETQKLESLGMMAGGIAHDFNNLLTGILGHVSLMRAATSSSMEVQEHARYIETAAQRAADLCRQMLAYSGRGRVVSRRLSLDDLVRETAELVRLSISKGTCVKLRLKAPDAIVQGDPGQLQQVIMNLVLNASEACEGKQGLVTLTTGVESVKSSERRSPHMVLDILEGTFAFLEVKDDGAGMTPQTQARMFDPFFTTKFTGRGLGLSAVLGIVRGHSGAVGVESELGHGTKFRVLLPVASGEPEAAVTRTPDAAVSVSGTVLVVDDEELVRNVARRILLSLGLSVVTASDGQEAVDLVRHAREPFAAILMDLTMPRLDGVAAYEQIRELDPCVPVLLMTGYDEQDAITRFSSTHLAGFVQKPFTAETLQAKIGSAVRAKS